MAPMLDLPRLSREGARLAQEHGLNPADPGDGAWALLVDALRTYKALPDPTRPRGYPRQSAMPEPHRERWELFGIEREWLTEGIKIETRVRHTPDSRAIDRAEEALRLWRPATFTHAFKSPAIVHRAILTYAAGRSLREAAVAYGIARNTLSRHRKKAAGIVGDILSSAVQRAA